MVRNGLANLGHPIDTDRTIIVRRRNTRFAISGRFRSCIGFGNWRCFDRGARGCPFLGMRRLIGMTHDGEHVFASDSTTISGSGNAAEIDADFTRETTDCRSCGNDIIAEWGRFSRGRSHACSGDRSHWRGWHNNRCWLDRCWAGSLSNRFGSHGCRSHHWRCRSSGLGRRCGYHWICSGRCTARFQRNKNLADLNRLTFLHRDRKDLACGRTGNRYGRLVRFHL